MNISAARIADQPNQVDRAEMQEAGRRSYELLRATWRRRAARDRARETVGLRRDETGHLADHQRPQFWWHEGNSTCKKKTLLTFLKTASEYRNVLMASILVMSIAVKNLQVFIFGIIFYKTNLKGCNRQSEASAEHLKLKIFLSSTIPTTSKFWRSRKNNLRFKIVQIWRPTKSSINESYSFPKKHVQFKINEKTSNFPLKNFKMQFTFSVIL